MACLLLALVLLLLLQRIETLQASCVELMILRAPLGSLYPVPPPQESKTEIGPEAPRTPLVAAGLRGPQM